MKIVSATATSKDFTISGRLIDSLHVPIPFANICLLADDIDSILVAAISDTTGNFTISYSVTGHYNLRISRISFESRNIQIALTPGEKKIGLGDITLLYDPLQLKEIIVQGKPNDIHYQVDRMVYTPDSLSLVKSVAGFDLLRYVPGVTVSPVDKSISVKGNRNVLILVDGRTSDKDLSTIHATEIKQIEIITNPSTRYNSDVENIVNIILKEEKNKGIQFTVDLEPAYKNTYFFGTVGLDYKNKKSRFFVKYNLSAQNMASVDSSIRIESYDGAEMRYNTNPVKNSYFSARSHIIDYGVDYSVNQKNFFNITCNYFLQDAKEESYDEVKSFTNDTLLTHNFYSSLSHSIIENQNYSFFYKRSFSNPDHEIWLSSNTFLLNRTTTGDYSSGETENLNNFTEAWNEETRNRQQSNDTRLEYFYTKNSLKVETGYHFYIRNIDNTLNSSESNENFTYSDIRQAAFANIVFRKNNFSLQTGARVENTGYKVNVKKEDDFLYPLLSLSCTYNFKKNNAIRFTYNRRLSYPSYRILVPFTYYTADSLSSSSGNSYLKPSLADKVELSFSTEKEDYSFLISAVAKKYKDYLGVQYSLANGVLSSQYQNFSTILAAGGEFSFSASLLFLELNLDGNLYYWDYPGTDHDGLSHILSAEITVNLPADFTADVELDFFNKSINPYGYRNHYTPSVYLFIEKALFKNKASLGISYMCCDRYKTVIWNDYFTETNYSQEKDIYIGIDFSFFFNRGKKISPTKSKLYMEHDEEKK